MDIIKEIRELKNQLAYSKNVGFFFGAGTSCALGIPNIATLTVSVRDGLDDKCQKHFDLLGGDVAGELEGRSVNIEDILNQVRRIREITCDREEKSYLAISGKDAKELDGKICGLIYSIITDCEDKADTTQSERFLSWLNVLNHEYSKEIFTTNYDLILERALEICRIPYFDGFVGSYEPFFYQDSVDRLIKRNELTSNWIRLWKIHGSLSWFWKDKDGDGSQSIIRAGKFQLERVPKNELVIYPSKEKYDSSRKQPFISYFDRLKNYLLDGELLFIFSGYSFSDQHINELIFNCLRQNNRLYCIVLCYQDSEVEKLDKLVGTSFMNMSVFGPKKAIVNGALEEWTFEKAKANETEPIECYWDETAGSCKLGDFNALVEFLTRYSGKRELLEVAAK